MKILRCHHVQVMNQRKDSLSRNIKRHSQVNIFHVPIESTSIRPFVILMWEWQYHHGVFRDLQRICNFY